MIVSVLFAVTATWGRALTLIVAGVVVLVAPQLYERRKTSKPPGVLDLPPSPAQPEKEPTRRLSSVVQLVGFVLLGLGIGFVSALFR